MVSVCMLTTIPIKDLSKVSDFQFQAVIAMVEMLCNRHTTQNRKKNEIRSNQLLLLPVTVINCGPDM